MALALAKNITARLAVNTSSRMKGRMVFDCSEEKLAAAIAQYQDNKKRAADLIATADDIVNNKKRKLPADPVAPAPVPETGPAAGAGA